MCDKWGAGCGTRRALRCLRAAVCVLLALVSAGAAPRSQSPRSSGGGAPSGVSFDALRQRADEARTAGRLQEAIDFYRRAIRLRPSWVEGHWYLGTINYEIDKYEECRNAFRTVVRLQKVNGAAWAFKGLCEFHVRNYRTALNALNEGQDLGVKD